MGLTTRTIALLHQVLFDRKVSSVHLEGPCLPEHQLDPSLRPGLTSTIPVIRTRWMLARCNEHAGMTSEQISVTQLCLFLGHRLATYASELRCCPHFSRGRNASAIAEFRSFEIRIGCNQVAVALKLNIQSCHTH